MSKAYCESLSSFEWFLPKCITERSPPSNLTTISSILDVSVYTTRSSMSFCFVYCKWLTQHVDQSIAVKYPYESDWWSSQIADHRFSFSLYRNSISIRRCPTSENISSSCLFFDGCSHNSWTKRHSSTRLIWQFNMLVTVRRNLSLASFTSTNYRKISQCRLNGIIYFSNEQKRCHMDLSWRTCQALDGLSFRMR